MPNWCGTRIIFHGDKFEVEDFHKKIEEWTSKEFIDTDFGTAWLGNILYGVGLEERIDYPTNRLRCRGWIYYISEIECFDDDHCIFVVDTETAWGPMLGMWKAVIDELLYSTVGFSYQAEESGCELYEIYDPYGDFDGEDYCIDLHLEGEDKSNERFKDISEGWDICSKEDAENILRKIFENDVDDIHHLITLANDYPFINEDSWLMIHEYNRVDSYSE